MRALLGCFVDDAYIGHFRESRFRERHRGDLLAGGTFSYCEILGHLYGELFIFRTSTG